MSSGATIDTNRCCLAPSGNSLKRFVESNLPFYTLSSLNYHILQALSTVFRIDDTEKYAYNRLYFNGTVSDLMKLSLVVPCYNEAGNVQSFQDAFIGAFDGCGYDYEIIFVDDGSRDAT